MRNRIGSVVGISCIAALCTALHLRGPRHDFRLQRYPVTFTDANRMSSGGWCPGPDDGSLAETNSKCHGRDATKSYTWFVLRAWAHQCDSLVPHCMRRRPSRGARSDPPRPSGSCHDYNKNPHPRQLCYISLEILHHEPGSCYYLRQAPASSRTVFYVSLKCLHQ